MAMDFHRLTLWFANHHLHGEIKHALRQLNAPIVFSNHNVPDNVMLFRIGSSNQPRGWPKETLPTNQLETEGFYLVALGCSAGLLAANTTKGLANGLYHLRRIMQVNIPDKVNFIRLLTPTIHRPAFANRDAYHFLSPWRLPHLSMDSFTMAEWRSHLDTLRALQANRVYVDLWSDQYYHPDYPETQGNKPLWEKLRVVLAYARELGLRTGFYIFPCQVPVSQWRAHPEARAVEAANYHGIQLCWTRGKKWIIPFDRFRLEYFNDVVDDLVIELEDPGVCLCRVCCNQFAGMVLDILQTYRRWHGASAHRRVDLCTLHFRDWIEAPGRLKSGVARPVPNLRRDVFRRLAKDTMIIDADGPTLTMAREHGLSTGYFFFDLDPESGLEDEQVFPRPHLARIESQIQSSIARGDKAVQAYRMMPQSQFVADYVLFRKLWDPPVTANTVLVELGASLGLGLPARGVFADAIRALEAWWRAGDVAAVKTAEWGLARTRHGSTPLTDLHDLVSVLAILAETLAKNPRRVIAADFYPEERLVDCVYERIRESRIFEAYTIHQHWVIRSREMLGQRLRWWLRTIHANWQSGRRTDGCSSHKPAWHSNLFAGT